MALVDSFDAIVFDYGGVLVRHQSDEDQARMAGLLKMPRELFHDLYWERRVEYDTASLTAAQYWQDVARRGSAHFTETILQELVRIDTESWMQFDDAMWEWVAELRKAGKQTAILSNMPRELGEALKVQTERLGAFDQVTLSYEVGVSKPEPAIYEHCLEGLNAAAERSLFFDDRIENIQGAERLGMRAIQVLDRENVLLQVR